ncbi:MAG: hypothetical protein RR514_01305 [Christensenella sp.]
MVRSLQHRAVGEWADEGRENGVSQVIPDGNSDRYNGEAVV